MLKTGALSEVIWSLHSNSNPQPKWILNNLASLAKWLSVCLWTKRLWVRMSFQSVIHQVMSGNINFFLSSLWKWCWLHKKTQLFQYFLKLLFWRTGFILQFSQVWNKTNTNYRIYKTWITMFLYHYGTFTSLWFFFDLPVYRQFISSHSREAKILLYMNVIYNWNYKLQK